MQHKFLNGVQTFAPESRNELIDYAFENKSILVAVNAEKILHATDESRLIINRNIGYPDGIGAVWALKKKGAQNPIKIPGCELWLDVIKKFENSKSFYLIGGSTGIINETVNKLRLDFPNMNILNFRNGYFKTVEEKENSKNRMIQNNPMKNGNNPENS